MPAAFEVDEVEPDEDLPMAILAHAPHRFMTRVVTQKQNIVLGEPSSSLQVGLPHDFHTPESSEDKASGGSDFKPRKALSVNSDGEDELSIASSNNELVKSVEGCRSTKGRRSVVLDGVYPPPLKMTAQRTGPPPCNHIMDPPLKDAFLITQNSMPDHKCLNKLFKTLMGFCSDAVAAGVDSEEYQTLVLDFTGNSDFQANPSIHKIFPAGPSQEFKHPFKITPSWGLKSHLSFLGKVPVVNVGSYSYSFTC
ncbi:hypothetical protein BDP27DRAFT_1365603 [Rhodocollybia butyracea]|uniref:Uncharacterized protein n=1 Tax=Rhodocollybia butyracea TaxID=206335 RepID=A0A9P5PQS6_9AGAR|nr:hypothetical protein BDP27DRAFT_1365603 [Rhodocollybia butyracea]